MRPKLVAEELNGVVVIEPGIFEDDRGFFMEAYRTDHFTALGIPDTFVQDNHSRSARGVLRGLHFQYGPPMGKLMRVTQGAAYLVAVDIRPGSPTLGKHLGLEVSAENRLQVWAPAGFARGFCVLSEDAEIQYKCSSLYDSSGESAIRWNDPRIAIAWPISDPTLSGKDQSAQSLAEWLDGPEAKLFQYSPAG